MMFSKYIKNARIGEAKLVTSDPTMKELIVVSQSKTQPFFVVGVHVSIIIFLIVG